MSSWIHEGDEHRGAVSSRKTYPRTDKARSRHEPTPLLPGSALARGLPWEMLGTHSLTDMGKKTVSSCPPQPLCPPEGERGRRRLTCEGHSPGAQTHEHTH